MFASSGKSAVTGGSTAAANIKGKLQIGDVVFEVEQADITMETTQCIVNGTNDKLDLKSGMLLMSCMLHSLLQN